MTRYGRTLDDMLVEDVMTPHPVTATATTSVKEALGLLDRYSVSSLPVVDGHGRICGVVSETDLIRERVHRDPRARASVAASNDPSPLSVEVHQVCSREAVTVRAHDDLVDAVELMTSTAVRSLPVVDRRGVVVGMISRRDVVHVLARPDSRIEAEVAEQLNALGHPDWLVDVDDGVVAIEGPSTDHQCTEARVMAAAVPGVVDVRAG